MAETTSPDTQAIISAMREIAAQQKAEADARQEAAERRADERAQALAEQAQLRAETLEANVQRRHADRIRRDDEAQRALYAFVLKAQEIDLAPVDVPGPLPVTPALPTDLNDEQAARYLPVIGPEFDKLGIPRTIERAQWHWNEYGRDELLTGKWPLERPAFTP